MLRQFGALCPKIRVPIRAQLSTASVANGTSSSTQPPVNNYFPLPPVSHQRMNLILPGLHCLSFLLVPRLDRLLKRYLEIT